MSIATCLSKNCADTTIDRSFLREIEADQAKTSPFSSQELFKIALFIEDIFANKNINLASTFIDEDVEKRNLDPKLLSEKEHLSLFISSLLKSRTSKMNDREKSEFISKIENGLYFIKDRLISFLTLRKGWDSYNASSIEWQTISRAIDFFIHILCIAHDNNKDVLYPFVAPCSDGGIQFEWKTCYKETMVLIPEKKNDPINYLLIDKTLREENEIENICATIKDCASIISPRILV